MNKKLIALDEQSIKFLNKLQAELLNENKILQADPKFWGIMDYRWDITEEYYGDTTRIFDQDGYSWNKKDFLIYLKDEYLDETAINILNKKYKINLKTGTPEDLSSEIEYIITSVNDYFNDNEFKMLWVIERNFLVQDIMFLTKLDAEQHLKENKHHYTQKAKVFGMTAFRSPSFEKLLEILKSENFNIIK